MAGQNLNGMKNNSSSHGKKVTLPSTEHYYKRAMERSAEIKAHGEGRIQNLKNLNCDSAN